MSKKGAFYTGEYPNLFLEIGKSKEEVEARLEAIFQEMYHGPMDRRIYHEAGVDMGYLEDTGNHDARTEGMSYGMMVCVQLNKKEEFDRIWKWSLTYMYMTEGENAGYFAWSVGTDGKKNSNGPAPDGEEYFAMALFFASKRWGDGEGLFAYSKWARQILNDCVHKGEKPGSGHPMWEPSNKLIKFVPNCDFTDPSYHLPHFYELFALWAEERDREFWQEVAKASRDYLKLAMHPETGLNAEYAYYDGRPHVGFFPKEHKHDWFYSDAYRTIGNIALDHVWFAPDQWHVDIANKHQHFFSVTQGGDVTGVFDIDGTPHTEKALHPVGLLATIAQASLAADGAFAKSWVQRFWDEPLRTGERRYYDNCLYIFAFMALAGCFKIYQ